MQYNQDEEPLIRSIREKCRICYTCVRECPAKAIRVVNGQAEIIPGRCIGCGNCVLVCSQKAKQILSGIEATEQVLASGQPCAAIIAPSFPAEFPDQDYQTIVGLVRALGFTYVNEVSFGADLVAQEYVRLLGANPDKRYIGSTCPAMVTYIEHYYPDLVDYLAPIVSPMVATARALKHVHGPNLKIVFIGPCVAKKHEQRGHVQDLDSVLTFVELKTMISIHNLNSDFVSPSEMDPPYAARGHLFPISRGLLETARISEDLIENDMIATDGKVLAIEAIREFSQDNLKTPLLEILCCSGGCIMGAGLDSRLPLFKRRSAVLKYTRKRIARALQPETDWAQFSGLDLTRTFTVSDQRLDTPDPEQIREVLREIGKAHEDDELNCGACGYETCQDHAIAIIKGLAEKQMCLPYTIERLKDTVRQIEESSKQLNRMRNQLTQSEKLASMGQMAAGIAHEVNNPLGIVLMYAHLLAEQYENDPEIRDDVTMIVEQANRCKKILSGLLNFARQNKMLHESTELGEFIAQSLKSVAFPKGIVLEVQAPDDPLFADFDRDQFMQVMINLYTNAVDAMAGTGTLTIAISAQGDMAIIRVSDTGSGIETENLQRIFEPFFTTKQMGKGTGLGLAVTYGIIKMHRGKIKVTSNTDIATGPTGTEFEIRIPRKAAFMP